ncbi:hypothetical protein HCY95_00054 [Limosilactobacillus fermentum]|uniref:Uncharacterized protein n=1 Tax=Limosilactobacillus fermentum TaxID=1613 RepID=A0AAJ4GDU8_LIMFE|nr:hypothetical protein HCY95_00054 [Limosilactobacillus fermentum]
MLLRIERLALLMLVITYLSIIGENTPTSTSGGILASLKHDSAFSFALWYI